MSCLVAFAVGEKYRGGNGFHVIAAHTDSPCLKLKPKSASSKSGYLMLNVQTYGVSADMAHGVHPNFIDKHEEHHRPELQKGLVIKHNANQRYATSGVTAFLFKEVARIHNLPTQEFVVRNDMGCGSTIGPILASSVGIRTLDCGKSPTMSKGFNFRPVIFPSGGNPSTGTTQNRNLPTTPFQPSRSFSNPNAIPPHSNPHAPSQTLTPSPSCPSTSAPPPPLPPPPFPPLSLAQPTTSASLAAAWGLTTNPLYSKNSASTRAKSIPRRSAERFDPREHSWTRIESMKTKRGCHSMAVLNEKLYAIGGYDGSKMVPSVEIFDPRLGTIYVIGGVKPGDDKKRESIVDTVERYKKGQGWQVTNLRAIGERCFFSAIVL
ncbi:hypothetical protein Vadar_015434 [Vaccinium darrowii]|nr:hypothetical protein Vadar_015434 [Vaccinium darrowii]